MQPDTGPATEIFGVSTAVEYPAVWRGLGPAREAVES
jgi:hypothetical protein